MRIALIAAAVATWAGTAQAATYTYNFSADFGGYLTTDGDSASTLTDTYAAFATITGSITFDDTLIGVMTPTLTDYEPAVIDIDGFDMSEFERLPTRTRIRNDDPSFGDSITTTFAGVNSSDPNGLYDILSLQFVDSSKSVFSDTSFPTLIDPADFEISVIRMYSSEKHADGDSLLDDITFNVTDLELVSEVPLPAGIWMLGGGLAALGALRRRRRS